MAGFDVSATFKGQEQHKQADQHQQSESLSSRLLHQIHDTHQQGKNPWPNDMGLLNDNQKQKQNDVFGGFSLMDGDKTVATTNVQRPMNPAGMFGTYNTGMQAPHRELQTPIRAAQNAISNFSLRMHSHMNGQ